MTPQTNSFRNRISQALFNQALDRAYRAFAHCNPEWTASLFDEHFLTHTAASLFFAYYQRGELPSAGRLASLWARQLPTMDRKHHERRIAEATTAAYGFLLRLSAELSAQTSSSHLRAVPASEAWAGDTILP